MSGSESSIGGAYETMKEWLSELHMAFGGNWWYLVWYAAAFVVLFFACKGWRKWLVIPSFLVSVVILNPVFYSLWNSVIGRSYWRTLWILPVVVFAASVPADLVEKKKYPVPAVLLCAAVILLTGSFVYSNRWTDFDRAANPDKLPVDAVMVADALLELDDQPRVVTDETLTDYLRQYSPKIHSLYGRGVYGEVTDPVLAPLVYENLHFAGGDLNLVNEKMLENGYRYLVTDNTDPQRQTAISDAGFVFLRQVNRYGIYEAAPK